jgi:hypothetical protein
MYMNCMYSFVLLIDVCGVRISLRNLPIEGLRDSGFLSLHRRPSGTAFVLPPFLFISFTSKGLRSPYAKRLQGDCTRYIPCNVGRRYDMYYWSRKCWISSCADTAEKQETLHHPRGEKQNRRSCVVFRRIGGSQWTNC